MAALGGAEGGRDFFSHAIPGTNKNIILVIRARARTQQAIVSSDKVTDETSSRRFHVAFVSESSPLKGGNSARSPLVPHSPPPPRLMAYGNIDEAFRAVIGAKR